MSSDESRQRAQVRFEKLQKTAAEGAKAMAEYEANSRAVRARSEKLKALRLAKEADDLRRAAEAPPKAKAKSARSGRSAQPRSSAVSETKTS
jgi:hypothetical protein